MSICKHKCDLLQYAILGAVLSLIHEMVYVMTFVVYQKTKTSCQGLACIEPYVIIHNQQDCHLPVKYGTRTSHSDTDAKKNIAQQSQTTLNHFSSNLKPNQEFHRHTTTPVTEKISQLRYS